jgi:hypothetical protein
VPNRLLLCRYPRGHRHLLVMTNESWTLAICERLCDTNTVASKRDRDVMVSATASA